MFVVPVRMWLMYWLKMLHQELHSKFRARRHLMTPLNNSTADEVFLSTLRHWIDAQGEMLLMIRFAYAAGVRSYELFTDFKVCEARIASLPRRTSIIAFKGKQLPFRGIVDAAFIDAVCREIPDGVEWLAVDTQLRSAGRESWYQDLGGETRAQLRQELETEIGRSFAVGIHPPWLDDSEVVISAIVPDEDGQPRPGAY